MDKLDRIILGIGIFCAVIGLQLGLHNSDIRKLKNEVKNCIKSSFNYEIEENCEIIERESFFTFDFMEVCFSSGYNLADKPLCIKKEDVNHHVNKALNKLMCRIIKTVMNYQN